MKPARGAQRPRRSARPARADRASISDMSGLSMVTSSDGRSRASCRIAFPIVHATTGTRAVASARPNVVRSSARAIGSTPAARIRGLATGWTEQP